MRTLRLGQQFDDRRELQVDDLLQLLAAQRIENHDVVDAIQKFRTECGAQRFERFLASAFGIFAPRVRTAPRSRRCWS